MAKPAQSYRDLIVWQKGMGLTKAIYRVTRGFPREELYALTTQIRKCAVSIPSNIAEGFGRHGRAEYLRFLYYSRGSLFELETELEIASEESYLSKQEYCRICGLIDETERLLESLIHRVENAMRDSE